MDDLSVTALKTKDVTDYTIDGDRVPVRQYTFYLGNHGPFVEKVPLKDFDPNVITQRIATIRAHLQMVLGS